MASCAYRNIAPCQHPALLTGRFVVDWHRTCICMANRSGSGQMDTPSQPCCSRGSQHRHGKCNGVAAGHRNPRANRYTDHVPRRRDATPGPGSPTVTYPHRPTWRHSLQHRRTLRLGHADTGRGKSSPKPQRHIRRSKTDHSLSTNRNAIANTATCDGDAHLRPSHRNTTRQRYHAGHDANAVAFSNGSGSCCYLAVWTAAGA